ncbi:MAG: CopG family transcriptional regulator [Candidatus Schekmanbacteria bacterium RBG_13_48_7]|uniref:CopG family transcriptional regulator n=1 Tax=Candidatus Schekmanbacteria bacterium RBG_13_48_7 TaxID=1817878 RepID=A0A1F7RM46_9BACT|nr:MAG: CopG family transcriptional regulator [Candidatus Schekmanbacteria bacterium RBG_13_48_7]
MNTQLKESKVTIKIPRPLYKHIQKLIEGSGFNSVTDFIVYVLRDVISIKKRADGEFDDLTREEVVNIREKLRNLGYL